MHVWPSLSEVFAIYIVYIGWVLSSEREPLTSECVQGYSDLGYSFCWHWGCGAEEQPLSMAAHCV